MLYMEESILRGGINASDCGTGKTVTCLGLIEHSARLQAEAMIEGESVFRPTLVACPSQLIDVWYDDWNKFFNGPDRLVLKQFYGSEATITNPARKATLLGTRVKHLIEYLQGLDPTDPATARIVIVTAYSTWHKRTLMGEEVSPDPMGKGKAREDAEGDDEGYDPNDEDEIAVANPKMIYTSSLCGFFDRVICDEAHALKNRGTLTHLAIKTLNAPKKWFISATPMINHVRDLTGYLSLLWDDNWALGDDLEDDEFYSPDLDAVALLDEIDETDEDKLALKTAVNSGQNVFQLNPARYRALSSSDKPDSGLVGLALRAILSQIQLRHTMATEIDMGDKKTRIGENIPHYRVTTVELAMSSKQAQAYQIIYDTHVSKLHQAEPSKSGNNICDEVQDNSIGRLNMAAHRRLVHGTFNPHLDTLVSSVGKRSLVKDINKWYASATDFGVTHFFKHTRPAKYFQPYQDRLGMAEYMAGPSAKIQYLCGLLYKICIVEEKRVQIVVDMPMNQW